MIQHLPQQLPDDPRAAPLVMLRSVMPFAEDREARDERRLLHRADLRERIWK